MTDILLETIRAVLVGVVFTTLLFTNKTDAKKHDGWLFIIYGFAFIFFGMLIDITDNFTALNRFVIIGDTKYQAFLEKVIGYLLGFSLLAIGFWKWLPAIAEVATSKEKTEKSHYILLSVLDSMESIVYVADFKTYEILFLNKYARNMFGDHVGSTCWQVLQKGQKGPCGFCNNEKLISTNGDIHVWEFQNTINGKWYDVRDKAIEWIDGRKVRIEIATDVTDNKQQAIERENLIRELQTALNQVKTLQGIIPICANCKKIRDDEGYWKQVEEYICQHTEAHFSHSICRECMVELYPDDFSDFEDK